MERKKELKQLYKETTIEAGVYKIKNILSEKIFIGSTPNLKTLNGIKFMLENGGNSNKMLQADWDEFGKEAFVFEIVEILKKNEAGYFNEKKRVRKT